MFWGWDAINDFSFFFFILIALVDFIVIHFNVCTVQGVLLTFAINFNPHYSLGELQWVDKNASAALCWRVRWKQCA